MQKKTKSWNESLDQDENKLKLYI
mgnify:CR=1